MAINRIDYDLCVGCGKCVNACRYDVLRMDAQTKKPKIVYLDECVLCNQCMKDCLVHAIELVPGVRMSLHFPTMRSSFSFAAWRADLLAAKDVYEHLHEDLLYTDEKQDFNEAVAVFEQINTVFEGIGE